MNFYIFKFKNFLLLLAISDVWIIPVATLCRDPESLNITTLQMDAEKKLTLRNVPNRLGVKQKDNTECYIREFHAILHQISQTNTSTVELEKIIQLKQFINKKHHFRPFIYHDLL